MTETSQMVDYFSNWHVVELSKWNNFSLVEINFLQHRHPINLAAREQKRADAVNFRGILRKFLRVRADGLDVRQFALRIHAADERRPRIAHGGFKLRAVEQALIHAPRQRVGVKTGATGFLERITVRVEQARAPESVRLLAGQEFRGHVLEQLLEARSVGMLAGQEFRGHVL